MSRGSDSDGERMSEAHNEDVVVLRDRRVCDFYRRNPGVSADRVNRKVVEMFESLGVDDSSTTTSSLTSAALGELLESVREVKGEMGRLGDGVALRMHEGNQAFLENVRTVVGHHASENAERVMGALQRTSDAAALLEGVRSELREQLASASESTSQTVEARLHSSMQPLYAYFSSNHEQVASRLDGLRDEVGAGRAESGRLSSEMGEFLSKHKNSSLKGAMGENRLEGVLSEVWPTAEVLNTTGQRACCDFRLVREGKADVLVETKAYDRNVNAEEVRKFQRDCEEQALSGVFLSQSSGVSGRPNYHMEVRGARVLVYVHNVDYDRAKIKMAVDVVDVVSERLAEMAGSGSGSGSGSEGEGASLELTVPQYVLEEVGKEYTEQMRAAEELGATLRESHKRAMEQVVRVGAMPSLGRLLVTHLGDAYRPPGRIVCDICNVYEAKNAKALTAHKRGCVLRNPPASTSTSGSGASG